ncbi:hypothetical protein Pmani_013390 [Petrolisthes manimaculis]|uniref:Uncharacterized protein n=1 Tax=Petrolisthes manimaculis TaxID=1843537 RepID=A0AAE1PXJ2_9EUCA|nr:hypothetical protein Pmani_013390 [Petrolisthes manimaculis]
MKESDLATPTPNDSQRETGSGCPSQQTQHTHRVPVWLSGWDGSRTTSGAETRKLHGLERPDLKKKEKYGRMKVNVLERVGFEREREREGEL